MTVTFLNVKSPSSRGDVLATNNTIYDTNVCANWEMVSVMPVPEWRSPFGNGVNTPELILNSVARSWSASFHSIPVHIISEFNFGDCPFGSDRSFFLFISKNSARHIYICVVRAMYT